VYVVEAVELNESPLRCWQRIARDDGAVLRSLGTRLAAEAGALRTLLGFRQPTEAGGRPVAFDCDLDPEAPPGGAATVLWTAGAARLEGRLEVVPDGTVTELRLSAAYEPPWGATLVAGRVALRRVVSRGLRDMLERLVADDDRHSDGRRRVLLEDADPVWQRIVVGLVEGDEWEFDGCGGPARAPGGCPVLRGESCAKVDAADVIVHSLDGAERVNAVLREALLELWPDAAVTPVPGERPASCLIRDPGVKKASSDA